MIIEQKRKGDDLKIILVWNMNSFLYVFQVGDDGKSHDYKQRPGTPFADVDS